VTRRAVPNRYYDALLYVGIVFLIFGVLAYLLSNDLGALIAALLSGPCLIVLSIAHRRNRQRVVEKLPTHYGNRR
jgi:FtsH-binding integral membrane protein